MNDIYRDARERERDRRLINLGLPCMCWVMVTRCGGRDKSAANRLHVTWIFTDLILTFATLLTYCVAGYHFMGSLIVMLTIHLLWNMICVCLAFKSGKKRGDFLIPSCCCGNLCLNTFFHLIIMLIMAGPLAYAWVYSNYGIVFWMLFVEIISYGLRSFVVTFVGCCCPSGSNENARGYQQVP